MGEIVAKIIVGDKEVEADSERTFVYRFLGKLSVYDHIYVQYDDDDDKQSSCYIWSDSKIYPKILKSAEECNVVTHVNLREISEYDEKNFIRHHTTDLGDSFPEEWNKTGPEDK